MGNLREAALRYPSASATFLRVLGAIIVVIGVLLAFSPAGDLVGLVAVIGGLIVFGLGSLRKALGDAIYELRAAADRTSNHSVSSDN